MKIKAIINGISPNQGLIAGFPSKRKEYAKNNGSKLKVKYMI